MLNSLNSKKNSYLIKKGCDRIITSVQNKQKRGNFSFSKVKQFILLADDLLQDQKQREKTNDQVIIYSIYEYTFCFCPYYATCRYL